MPDTLDEYTIFKMRQRAARKQEMSAVKDRERLLAHLDALTAAFAPYIDGNPDSYIVPMTVGQLRAILGEPHDA